MGREELSRGARGLTANPLAMDNLTHGLLGAATGYLCLGRKLGWKAAAVGLVAGELPDLDLLIRSGRDPLLALEYHRHFTHSFAFSPVIATVAAAGWVVRERHRPQWREFWLAALLATWSHILCDAWTSYGTSFLVPFSRARFSGNLLSIIDPVFTGALLLGLVAAWRATRLARRRQLNELLDEERDPAIARGRNPLFQPRWVAVAMGFCAAYLVFGGVQQLRARRAQAQLAASRGHQVGRSQVMPTLGNLVAWRALYEHAGVIHRDRIRVGLFSAARYAPGDALPLVTAEQLTGAERARDRSHQSFARFAWFTDGWVARAPEDPTILGDARYSMSPARFEPIWGIRFTPPSATAEIEWVNRSRDRRIDRAELWSEISGRNPDYRPVAGAKSAE